MMKPITKRSTSIADGSRIPTTIRQAFKLSQAERPGVVHIELAEDIAGEKISDIYKPLVIQDPRRPVIDEKMFHQLVSTIKSSKYPLILI